jgi:hypothetical protein
MILLGLRVGTGPRVQIAMPDWPTGLMCMGACIRRFTPPKDLDATTTTLMESCERADLSLVGERKQLMHVTLDMLVTLVEIKLVKES